MRFATGLCPFVAKAHSRREPTLTHERIVSTASEFMNAASGLRQSSSLE
jgi:hypothetical protein